MSRIGMEILALSHSYRRKGGKLHRREQVRRLIIACEWVDTEHQVGTIHRIGKRHVIKFWKGHRQLAKATLLGYFYAFKLLWDLLARSGDPPYFKIPSAPQRSDDRNHRANNNTSVP